MEPFDDMCGDVGGGGLRAFPTQAGCGDRCGKLVELLEDDHKERPLPSRTHCKRGACGISFQQLPVSGPRDTLTAVREGFLQQGL